MKLKRFKNFYTDLQENLNESNGAFVQQLINANVIGKNIAHSSDFVNKLNNVRNATLVDMLLPIINDFNQHENLDFVDFWNKKKNDYNLAKHLRDLDGDQALKGFFILDKKLAFNKEVIKDFFDTLKIPMIPEPDSGTFIPDKSRDASITIGSDKDHVQFRIKKADMHSNREMY